MSFYRTTLCAARRPDGVPSNPPDHPLGFDPARFPILSVHFFGIAPVALVEQGIAA